MLELGIGTGRIALPLCERGLRVHGIDLSPAMITRLRAKPGAERIRVTVGDFARTRVPGTQRLVSHHYRLVDGQSQGFSIPFRYVWPSELDLMARLAGLEPRDRWSEWGRQSFTSDSTKHVSVWAKPGP